MWWKYEILSNRKQYYI